MAPALIVRIRAMTGGEKAPPDMKLLESIQDQAKPWRSFRTMSLMEAQRRKASA